MNLQILVLEMSEVGLLFIAMFMREIKKKKRFVVEYSTVYVCVTELPNSMFRVVNQPILSICMTW